LQIDTLEQDAFEVLRLIRFWKNSLAPINRIPPEVLTLIPDFYDPDPGDPDSWDPANKDQDWVTLTHVCRTWRKAFISRPSLWTDFDCRKMNADKTRIYLERSKSSPVSLRLDEGGDLSPHNPFLQIVPYAINRLKSLVINGTPENLQDITARLSRPAPLLKYLSIVSDCTSGPHCDPMLTTALFDGEFPSLRKLRLQSVHIGLPWRDMINLTSFELCYMMYEVSIRQLLDFFESAPRLRKIQLLHATPSSGAQSDRLVSLACLEWMNITGDGSPSLLLDHLIIPIGAKLTIFGASSGPLTENLLPRSLDNLRNLFNFTDIHLHIYEYNPDIQFSGPNGQVRMFIPPRDNTTCLVLESLDRFDTSKTERLQIDYGYSPSDGPLHRALIPMQHLRTLTLFRCASPDIFIHALDPIVHSSGVVVCPRLEELVLVLCPDGETLDIKNVTEMAAARASRGKKLKSVKIISQDESVQIDVLELRKHVSNVDYTPEGDSANDEPDSSDAEDWGDEY
jgi:hypothetical protein